MTTITYLGYQLADLHISAELRLAGLERHRNRTAETFRAFITDLDTLRARMIESRDMIDADMAQQIADESALIGEMEDGKS